MLRSLGESILNFVIPRECPACRTNHEAAHALCCDCDEELDRLTLAPRCVRCAMPATLPGAPCAHCQGKGLSPFKKIVCVGLLKDPLKSIIHRAKYERRWHLSEQLADRVSRREDLQALLRDADLIVPVPLHPRQQRHRGFNQSEVIARRICKLQNRLRSLGNAMHQPTEIDDLQTGARDSSAAYQGLFERGKLSVKLPAVRVRDTETQTHLSRTKRYENLDGAFVLTDPAAITKRNVVLVDDVMTTGATLQSLARTLQPARPASLSAIVIAVADPKGRAFEVI